MLKKLAVIIALLSFSTAFSEPIEITPVQKISTSTKEFSIGNKYDFKDIHTGEIYTGEITYYRPNGMTGQEAQIEIGNFTNKNGETIEGKITVIPTNHKTFQEYSNYFVSSCSKFIRGSEVILLPEKHTFLINLNSDNEKIYSIKLIPAQEISTAYDKLDYGDILKFETTNDIYKNGKLFIKSGTLVTGKIDYLDENGWIGDNATIYIKTFETHDIMGNIIPLDAELIINGFELLKYKSKRSAQFFNYISSPFRGKEIDIKNYDTNINFVITVKE